MGKHLKICALRLIEKMYTNIQNPKDKHTNTVSFTMKYLLRSKGSIKKLLHVLICLIYVGKYAKF